ncbi:diguanylate cyclase [Lentibacillus kapialis]|uniref:Diguanylate cyclase n=1 Tax=Lentibacillus kapialis TaxID=340214 RepID=A0A917PUS7_9BACI|nr:sigma 54-interacting transcriptional regulator [Lentibacillus kapialis]GGJ93535.1 diguanylate cyclase [Lentibacillus kapialis]
MDESINTDKVEITGETLKELLDYLSDEIIIFNHNRQIIYANKACEKNYGLTREMLLGKFNHDLFQKKLWTPSIYPEIDKSKKPISIIQTTNTGAELLTSAIPILNDQDEVELLITTAKELHDHKTVTLNTNNKTPTLEEHGIITHSSKMQDIIAFCQKVAITNSTILIQGESGTGKGVLANYIHQISKRKSMPYLTINCAAIPEELLESELFGYTKGAFTGANPSGKAGLLEMGNNGTVFLDEIGDLSLSLQAKLLQVMQDKEFIPIGGNAKKKVNIRFIVATNRNLEKLIEKGQFREDLYYRLNVIDITLPPLRDRKEDIIPLIYHFLHKFNEEYESDKPISQDALDILEWYSWPGNIRQLANLMEKLVIISDTVIDHHALPEVFHQKKNTPIPLNQPDTLDDAVDQAKQHMIRHSFKKHRSSRKVAEDLKISQTTATKLIREYCNDLRQKQ